MKTRTAIALAAASAASVLHAADPVELDTFRALERPAPTAVIQYGPAAAQAVDLFLPTGNGPHPVAIMIHGGCWRNLPGAGREQLRHFGAELKQHGIAVWSIGYRRADEDGGGYPGTFQDVAAAIDRLQSVADRYGLDTSRTVLVGHSAGGHLALWASVRDQLPAGSPLHTAHPFVPGSVISVAGVADLGAFARFIPVLCGPGIAERLAPEISSDRYADISPAQLPAPRGRIVMISGILDRLVPPYVADDYARAMRRKHSKAIELIDISGAGHFDMVTPGTPAWKQVTERIIELSSSAVPSSKGQ